jgi:hypothetical protein
MCSGMIVAPSICIEKKREAVDPMNVDTLIMAVLFLTGTTLWVSVAIRGMQRAPLANAAVRDLNAIKAAGKRLAKRR